LLNTSEVGTLDCSGVANFCDRSPCPGMLEALGRWVFGSEDGGYLAVTGRARDNGTKHLDKIKYCPFCGTALEHLSVIAQEVIELPQ
jgi:ribosomal protein L33